MKAPSAPFRLRSFTSLLVALGFLALLVSGSVLLVSPPGRVANWTDWRMLGLSKHGWGDLHITFGALFVVGGLIHLAFNWRPMLQHLGRGLASRPGLRLEWVAAVLVGGAVFAGTRAGVPPFSSLLAWSEQVRGSWEENRDLAPISHAELLALRELVGHAGVEPGEALARLEASGLRGHTPDTRVQAIADAGRVTPARVYALIRKPAGEQHGGGAGGGGGQRWAGGGPGWKTLTQFCADEGLDAAVVRERLAARGIKAEAGQTMREIAVGRASTGPTGCWRSFAKNESPRCVATRQMADGQTGWPVPPPSNPGRLAA